MKIRAKDGDACAEKFEKQISRRAGPTPPSAKTALGGGLVGLSRDAKHKDC